MPSKQQFEELQCRSQTASKSQSFVIGWVFKSVNCFVLVGFFQLNAFLQVVSSSSVL